MIVLEPPCPQLINCPNSSSSVILRNEYVVLLHNRPTQYESRYGSYISGWECTPSDEQLQ